MQDVEQTFTDILDFNYIGFVWDMFWDVTFSLILKIIAGYFLIVWIALIVWVAKDIFNRTDSFFYQIISILTVLVWTPLWVVIYLLIRPSRTLFEKYYEEASVEDTPLEQYNFWPLWLECRVCRKKIPQDALFCCHCGEACQVECVNCKKHIRPNWKVCSYCWALQWKQNSKHTDVSTEKLIAKDEGDKKQKKPKNANDKA